MSLTTQLIAVDIVDLNKVPLERRSVDWRIAKGLLLEAVGFVRIGNNEVAERLRLAAEPYLRFAELV